MLFNEPKLLKWGKSHLLARMLVGFSALQRAEIAEIRGRWARGSVTQTVSVLFNEPKLLKSASVGRWANIHTVVSVLFNEPKLLKSQQALDAMTELAKFQCSSTSRNC